MSKAKKTIFLIEDDSAIIDIYETMMKKADFNVEVIKLGQEAIEKIKNIETGDQVKPDIILLDLILPDINGMEVLGEIRKNNTTKNIKVFIFTNQEETESQKSDTIRPDKFIVKANISPTQLLELIKQQLNV